MSNYELLFRFSMLTNSLDPFQELPFGPPPETNTYLQPN